MALTLRTNGTGGGLISASWFNDFYNLFTGVMTDQAVTFGNNLTVHGTSGIINTSGKWGQTAAGDLIDASGSTTYLKAGTGGLITLQIPNGTTILNFKFDTIECNNWLGIRTISGTRLGEFKGNGNFLIAGGTYQTVAGSPSLASGGAFDSFDVAEIFECDQNYPKGTVVCPGPNNKLVQCTHDNCHAALVISETPGLGMGVPDDTSQTRYIAIAGRVNALTSSTVTMKQLVVSDGKGGIRPVNYGEPSFVLGFALNDSVDGQVGIFLRSVFVMLTPASV